MCVAPPKAVLAMANTISSRIVHNTTVVAYPNTRSRAAFINRRRPRYNSQV